MYIRPDIQHALDNLKLPDDRSFGKAVLPIIVKSDYKDGQWSELEVMFDSENFVSGGSVAVQYAQSVFEGMKAYKVTQDIPQIFRPIDHANRFNGSAKRMCMPAISNELFVKAVKLISELYTNHIPSQKECALYLRPSMYGTDFSLAVAPSEGFSFTVHVAPTLPFASKMISVLIEREGKRSALGGTGNVKAAGNYAAGFNALKTAQSMGCATNLWLDPIENKYIEELSLMNFFIYFDGVLHTPKLQSSFLPGIVRNSLLTIAQDLGIKISEQRLDINQLIELTKSDASIEAFSSGTAAVVAPIKSFKEYGGEEHIISQNVGPITKLLKSTLIDIQEARTEDKYGWMQPAY